MRLIPVNIQFIGDELALVWNDGSETYLPLEYMRKHCPCAACGGEPDVMGHVAKPEVSYKPSSFRIRNYTLVGGYALQPTWEDGHTTGLYTFQYLRRLEAAQHAPDDTKG